MESQQHGPIRFVRVYTDSFDPKPIPPKNHRRNGRTETNHIPMVEFHGTDELAGTRMVIDLSVSTDVGYNPRGGNRVPKAALRCITPETEHLWKDAITVHEYAQRRSAYKKAASNGAQPTETFQQRIQARKAESKKPEPILVILRAMSPSTEYLLPAKIPTK
jgi:hypothetical protein